jgi:SAM-dependent methyltransferase
MGIAEREAKSRRLYRKYYAHLPSREEMLDAVVVPLLRGDQTLLDAGSGRTMAILKRYAPKVRFAVGVDVVAPVEPRDGSTAAVVADLASLPLASESVDIVVSRSVVEHLDDPVGVFTELARALKPGGQLIFTTPNKLYYSSIVASLVPYRWKDFYIRHAFAERYEHFPVRYRANTPGALHRLATRAGLHVRRLEALRHFPYALLFSPTLFRLGILYDWVVTRLRLDRLQSTWLVVMERPQRA